MDLAKYLRNAGRGAMKQLASDIEAHAPDVSRWASKKRPVPEKAATAIERVTAGAVTRRDLRPHDWHLIWPELAEQPAPKEVA